MIISEKDRQRLRQLAGEQAELAASDEMARLRADWVRHGRFEAGSRPMVRIEIGTFEQDVIPQLMRCEGEAARQIERQLLVNMSGCKLFGDDTLVPAYYAIRRQGSFVPFGIEVKREETGGVGHHFISQIEDLDEDFDKLGRSSFTLGEDVAEEKAALEGIFGDILPVREEGFALYATPMQDIVHIMSMEDMYVAMIDTPERFGEMLSMLADDYIAWFAAMEKAGLLHSACAGEHLCQGTYCYTDELTEKNPASLGDMWLYMDSQETSGISPEMYKELVFPHYKKVMDCAGLVSYGCCEAVDGIWDGCLDMVKTLRKVSISPWCDERAMGERLAGKRVVYLRKPSPNFLGVGSVLEEDAVRAHIGATVAAAKGCSLEIIQRDVYELHAGAEKVRRYVSLIREELEAHQ